MAPPKTCSQKVSKEELAMTGMILWFLWKRRNDLVWNGKRISDRGLINLIGVSLSQWQHAQTLFKTTGPMQSTCVNQSWTKPDHGWIKCNVDAVVFSDMRRIDFGFILPGAMIAAKNGLMHGPMESNVVKALSCREVLAFELVEDNGI